MERRGVPTGVFAPVATVFDRDGELDLDGFQEDLRFYAGSPLDGVVLLGSNGESALLDAEEKLRLIAAGVEAVDGRKIVMAGTGTESGRCIRRITRRT